MATDSVRRAFDLAFHAAISGQRDTFDSALARLQTLDRAGELAGSEILVLKAIAAIRNGSQKEADDAVSKLGGAGSVLAKRVREIVMDTPEASNKRYCDWVDSVLPFRIGQSIERKRVGFAVWAVAAAASLLLVTASAYWGVFGGGPDEQAVQMSAKSITSRPALARASIQGNSPAAKEYRRMVERVGKIVVRANLLHPNGSTIRVPVSSGTGFVVTKDGLLITNKHVVEISEDVEAQVKKHYNMEVLGWDYVVIFVTDVTLELDARVERLSAGVDLATVRVQAEFSEPFAFAKTPVPGETLRAFGFPGVSESLSEILNERDKKVRENLQARVHAGEEPRLMDWFGVDNVQLVVTSGIVIAVRSTEKGLMIQTDLFVTYGNSGGPLVTSTGEIVGVISLGATGNESTNMAIASQTVFEELGREPDIVWPKFAP